MELFINQFQFQNWNCSCQTLVELDLELFIWELLILDLELIMLNVPFHNVLVLVVLKYWQLEWQDIIIIKV